MPQVQIDTNVRQLDPSETDHRTPDGEGMNRRTDYIRSLTRAETKVIDARAGRVHAVVSTEARDRSGDIIRQANWNLDNFLRSPNLIDSHRYGTIEAVIGHWASMEVQGKKLVGEAVYHVDSQSTAVADLARAGLDLAARGFGAYSVGFIPDMSKAKEISGKDDFWTNYEFNGQELLEVSQVSVPDNPEALQRMKGVHPAIDEIVEEMLEAFHAESFKTRVTREQLDDPVFLKELFNKLITSTIDDDGAHSGGDDPDLGARLDTLE